MWFKQFHTIHLFVIVVFWCIAISTTAAASIEQVSSDIEVPMPDGRIVGGQDADIRQFPHQISMRYNGRHRCGGSVYSPNIIISACHCVMAVRVSDLSIVAGSTLLSEIYIELPVHKIIRHPEYSAITHVHDVAVLVMRGLLPFNSYIQPIALAKTRPAHDAIVTVTGWGVLVEGGTIPDHLQMVDVNFVDDETCRDAYGVMFMESMLCAGVTDGGKDACQGDSGGPLIFGDELLGVVSWGFGCARPRFPGVYAAIPDMWQWVEETAKNNTIQFAQE